MADYYFYRYRFKNVPAETLIGQEKESGSPVEILDRRLASRLMTILHFKRNGEVDKYNNVIYFHNGVALMRLQNNSSVPIHELDFSTKSTPTYPDVNVIIDNRDGHHFIAIERNGSFKKQKGDQNSTQRVARLMAESLNVILKVNGNAIEIMPITKKEGLYATMVNRIRKHNARVTSITYCFPSDDEEEIKAQQKGALAILTNLTRQRNGDTGGFFIKYNRGDEEDIKHVKEDFQIMELFIGRQNYEVDVKFDDNMGILRSGDLQWAHYEVLDRDIADFMQGLTSIGEGGQGEFQINIFLDTICKTLDEYEKK